GAREPSSSACSSTSGSGSGSASGTSSPSSPTAAPLWPAGTSPSSTEIFRRTPEASASTSCVTFSVSTSYSGSPFSTRSPSCLSQRTTVPDSIPWPSRGSLISVAISSDGREDGLENVVGVGNDPLLHDGCEGKRRELGSDALDGGVQPVEGLMLDERGDLGAEAHACDRLVGNHAAIRLLDRLDNGSLVERLQCAGVDDLDRDPLLLGLLGGAQRFVDEAPRCDDGDVLAFALHSRLAERDRLELVRHALLDPVQRAVLEEDDRIVVVDRAVEESADVRGRRRDDDLEPGDVHEPGLELLRVLRAG